MTYTVEYTRTPEERPGTHLVLLLHGYGSNEQDLLGLTRYLPTEGVTYAAMRAPQPVGSTLDLDTSSAYLPGTAGGYQWYPLSRTLTTNLPALELATDYVLDWLEAEAKDYASITLLGFSQGMAIATSVARRRPHLPAAILGLSGFVVASDTGYFDDAATAQAQIPVFYGHDLADPVIPADKVAYTQQWLAEHTRVEERLYSGIFHGVNLQELKDLADFYQSQVLDA